MNEGVRNRTGTMPHGLVGRSTTTVGASSSSSSFTSLSAFDAESSGSSARSTSTSSAGATFFRASTLDFVLGVASASASTPGVPASSSRRTTSLSDGSWSSTAPSSSAKSDFSRSVSDSSGTASDPDSACRAWAGFRSPFRRCRPCPPIPRPPPPWSRRLLDARPAGVVERQSRTRYSSRYREPTSRTWAHRVWNSTESRPNPETTRNPRPGRLLLLRVVLFLRVLSLTLSLLVLLVLLKRDAAVGRVAKIDAALAAPRAAAAATLLLGERAEFDLVFAAPVRVHLKFEVVAVGIEAQFEFAAVRSRWARRSALGILGGQFGRRAAGLRARTVSAELPPLMTGVAWSG